MINKLISNGSKNLKYYQKTTREILKWLKQVIQTTDAPDVERGQ